MSDIIDYSTGYSVVPLPRFGQGSRWQTEAMRSYSHPILIWFTKGQGRVTIAGSISGYGAHNAIFIPAKTMHGYEMTGQVFGSIVHIPVDAAEEFPSEPLQLRFRDGQQHVELSGMIDSLSRESQSTLLGKNRAMRHHGGLLAVWLERQINAQPDAELGTDSPRRLAAAFTALVERDFKSGKTVTDYANDLGITATHLSRVCNTACGKPASAILAERIHFEARRLLQETKTPVQEIAKNLGFRSPAYFTRAFQKNAGHAPSKFRKLH